MITGFNTDIEFDGITYHVQTEDKGLDNPLILSLVYVGGAILASKRAPYTDLVGSGFDESILTERLNRQHKLICAAVRSGRIEDLKRLSDGDAPAVARRAKKPKVERAVKPQSETAEQTHDAADEVVAPARVEPKSSVVVEAKPSPPPSPPGDAQSSPAGSFEPSILDLVVDYNDPIGDEGVNSRTPPAPLPPPTEQPPPPPQPTETLPRQVLEEVAGAVASAVEEDQALYLALLDDEGDFRAGELVTVRIRVGRGKYGQAPVSEASVTVKVLGTTFRPLILSTLTDDNGIAVVRALLPRFTSGRAAILIRAVVDGEDTELRRIIHQG